MHGVGQHSQHQMSWRVTWVALVCCALIGSVHSQHQTDDEDDDFVEVFILPHSHCDLGWIVSMESYYTSQVQYIFDTVIQNLMEHRERKFIMVEVGFLARWMKDATESKIQELHLLVDQGQIEFVLGGVVMSDEAVSNYVARINQLQEGHRFLVKEFGKKAVPRIGWQIDPFGHSRGTAALFAWDCMDAVVIDRIPYWDKNNRLDTKNTQFVWHGTDNLGNETDIFTHLLDTYMYCSSSSFAFGDAFDIYHPPNPNPPVESYNIQQRADSFVSNVRERAAWYPTNKILWPFGCDFNYVNADVMFKNMDKIIEYINANTEAYNVHVKYSLLSEYFDALHDTQQKKNITWPSFQSDFFPYYDNDQSYWTGFYTSQNTLKILTRKADNVLRVGDQLSSLALANGLPLPRKATYSLIHELRWQNAIVQHHDAVSGTSRAQVIDDYIGRLKFGLALVNPVIEQGAELLASASSQPKLSIHAESVAGSLLQNNTVAVVVYNSLGWTRAEYIRVGVNTSFVSVVYENGSSVPFELHETSKYGPFLYMMFAQVVVPPLGFATIFIEQNDSAANVIAPRRYEMICDENSHNVHCAYAEEDITIGNENLSLTFSKEHGLLSAIQRPGHDAVEVSQSPMVYNSYPDTNSQASGAYIFRNDGDAVPFAESISNVTIEVFEGSLVQAVAQEWVAKVDIRDTLPPRPSAYTQMWMLFTGFGGASLNETVSNHFELKFHLGPINGNQEFISRFTAGSIENDGQLAQDDSGFILMQRQYNETQSLQTPGNYYPMVSTAYIQDNRTRLTIISDKSHGCASLHPGELEVMLQRRTMQDDNRGMDEELYDITPISFAHVVQFDDPLQSENARHRLRLMLNNPLTPLFGTANTRNDWASNFRLNYTALRDDMPANVHVLSLQMYDGDSTNSTVLRLQHLFESSANSSLAAPVSIDLNQMFDSPITLESAVQRTLSGNRVQSECKRLEWNVADSKPLNKTTTSANPDKVCWNDESILGREAQEDDVIVELQPGQIQTFFVELLPT